MISFKVLEEETFLAVANDLSSELSAGEKEILFEIVSSLEISDGCDIEYALSVFAHCALIRVFDLGRYLFLYPYELSEKSDVRAAIEKISEYAMREEISLVFTDVPMSEIHIFKGFRHMDIDAEDRDAECYRVKINTECMLCEEIPEIDGDRVKLNAITESDIKLYARLCRDENVNKCWGYDYREDNKEPTDAYFYEMQMRDFAAGSAISLAIRLDGEFSGEAVIYAFNGWGSAEFAVRLLPEYQGKGIGRSVIPLVMEAASSIGLVVLRAKVMKENVKSIKMMSAFCDSYTDEGDSLSFELPLQV